MQWTRPNSTEIIQRRYNLLAAVFDWMEWPIERVRFSGWRDRLRHSISGPRALEAGVGTGRNMAYYPPDVAVTAIDFSERMLARAKRQAGPQNKAAAVDLRCMDVERLDFPDRFFDTVFATFVFCSVPDPVQGLRELRRVCKPGGKLLLLEHMRPGHRMLGLLFDLLNPLAVRATGANINRRTMDNLKKAGWHLRHAEDLSMGIVWWIEAVP